MIVGDPPEVVHGDHGAAIGFARFALVSCPQPNGFLELALLSALCCVAVRARARSAQLLSLPLELMARARAVSVQLDLNTHSGPSGGFGTARHSIGSMKVAPRAGRDRTFRIGRLLYHGTPWRGERCFGACRAFTPPARQRFAVGVQVDPLLGR